MRACVEERVEVVADDGIGKRVLQIVQRSEAQENRLLIWTTQVIVKFGDLYVVTLRSKKGNKRFGGYWEIGITETKRHGETEIEAARRGLEEELLIPIAKHGGLQRLFNYFYRNPIDTRDWKNVAVFGYAHNGEIRHNDAEIAAVRLILPKQIEREINSGNKRYTPMNIQVWDIYRANWV